jgi:hypothetical protein
LAARAAICSRVQAMRFSCHLSLAHDLVGKPVSTFPDHALN